MLAQRTLVVQPYVSMADCADETVKMQETATHKKYLVFTDLDGCLLDAENYEYQEALPTINQLKAIGIPIILCSSKTAEEMHPLWSSLNLDSPFVVENGAAVYIPRKHFSTKPPQAKSEGNFWVQEFGRDRNELKVLIDKVKTETQFEFKTFSDLGAKGIAELSGLSLPEAAKANTRQFSEPLQWLGNNSQRTLFEEKLSQLGASMSIGGRFVCVTGNHDKVTATLWLRRQYELEYRAENIQDLAIGDSPNDAAMLEAACTALIIPTADRQLLKIDKPPQQTIIGKHSGPLGWSQGVTRWLSAHSFEKEL
ncbi:MAG: HAD-IIB family hydrolase [Halioglobus sp.]